MDLRKIKVSAGFAEFPTVSDNSYPPVFRHKREIIRVGTGSGQKKESTVNRTPDLNGNGSCQNQNQEQVVFGG